MMTFKETGLNNDMIRAISELGYENPTPIQEQTIPHLLNSGADLIALAQTGTGKTAAFGLPIIQQTDTSVKNTQSLVLCPTRELCLQITNDMKTYSKYIDNFYVVPVYGGSSITTQINALKNGKQVVVGTPGRILDLINRKKLVLSDIRWLVLDEADEMLSMGFKDDLDAILDETPEEKQTLLFSATMSSEIKNITKKYMTNAEEITVGNKNSGAENVLHYYYVVNEKDKYESLKRIADVNPDIYGIVFCRTRSETQILADKLIQDGYQADALHGDLSQAQRDNVMNRFRIKHLQILVATDVAARGLDVNDLSHIINYQLPEEMSIYIHRIGRTGRAGKNGIAISLINNRETHKIKILERIVGKSFVQSKMPSGKEICEKQLYNFIDKVENVDVDEKQIAPFLSGIYNKLNELSREELINRFVSIEFNRFLSYYKNAPEIYSPQTPEKENNRSKGRKSYSRFYFNIGSKHKVNPMKIMGIINKHLGRNDIQIGKIEIMKKFSFVEIDSRFEKDVLNNINDSMYDNQPLVIELVEKQPMESRNEHRARMGNFDDKKSVQYYGSRNKGNPKIRTRRKV